MRTRRALAAVAAAFTFLAAGASVAYADAVTNTIDASVDSTAEVMALNVGGANGSTNLAWVQDANGAKNGCDLTGQTVFSASIASSNPAIATVSPSSVTFTACGQSYPVTVTPVSTGTTTISLTQTNNTTGGTIDLLPARFTVNVAPPANSAPTVTVSGVTNGGSYAYGSVPAATCNVTDAEDGNRTFPATLSAVTGPNASYGVGNQTASCSYTDAGGLTASSSATYSIVAAATTTTVTCPTAATTYTGSPLTPCTATVTGPNLSQSLTVSYSNNTNVGTATASASYAGDPAHLASSGSRTFTVGKAASVTTVTCPTNVAWTGAAQTPCTATATGAGGLSESLTPSYSNNTAVGTAAANATFAGDANHNGSSGSATFGIVRATSVISFTCTPGQVFTGAALTPCTARVTGPGLDQPLTVTYADNTNAGIATASASYAGDTSHAPASDSSTFAIAKASSTTAVTCPAIVTFTGSAQTPCSASVTGAGGLDQSLTVGYADNTNAGSATASASYTGDANHTASSDSTTFTIDKAASTTTVTCPTNVTYTGAALTPCTAAVAGAGGLAQSLTPSYADNIDAGSASAAAAFAGDANHMASNDAATFTIDKAGSTTSVSCPTNVTYTGAALEPCSASVTGAGGLSESLTVGYTANTDAGAATASASYAGDANHTASSRTVGFTIDRAASTVEVTCPSTPLTYTGSAQTPCSAAVTGAGGLAESLTPSYSDNTDAGTASAYASWDGDANHVGDSGSATFAIGQATPVVTVSCPDSEEWTGAAIEPCTAHVTGANGLDAELTPTYSGNTDLGTATASASYGGATGNYAAAHAGDTFEIVKARVSVSVTCEDATYTGSALETCTSTVTGAGGLSTVATLSYEDNTNAGTATATGHYAGDAHHLAGVGSDTFEIARADTTTVLTCSASEVYTGSAIEACSATVTGAALSAPVGVDYTDNTNVGTAHASATYAGDANHNGSSDAETFSITKAPSVTVVTCEAGPFTYSGSAYTPCTAAVSGAGSLNQSLPVGYTGNLHAGVANASASYAGDANHDPSSDTESFTIDKAATTTVVTCPTSVTYTGGAQEPCTAGVTGPAGLDTSLTVHYADNTDAGTASASASYEETVDYLGSADAEAFTIDQASSTTVVTCPASVVFDADPQTPCSAAVTGAGGLSETLTVGYVNNTNAGTATASAAYPGDANHTGSGDSTTFTIAKAPSTVTVTCTLATVEFDGTEHEPCSATLSGAGGLVGTPGVVYTENTHVGTVTASAGYLGDDNHFGDEDSTTFEITQAPSVTTVTCPTSLVYTGSALTPCTAEVTGVGGLSEPLAVTHTDNTVVGTAHAAASYPGDRDHTASSDDATFEVTRAPTVTTVTCSPKTVTFTGEAHEVCTAGVTGAALSQSLPVSYTGNVNAGLVTGSAQYEGDANHTGSSSSDTFQIEKASSTSTITCPVSVTFDGGAQEPCTAKVTGAGGLDADLDVTYEDNVHAGTATAHTSYAGDLNHEGSSDTETFAIDKASSSVTVTCPPSVVFDGSAQEPCTASVTGAGDLDDVLTVTYGANTNAGSATAAATFAGDDDHTGSSGDSGFTILKAGSTTTLTCPASEVYTGSPITPCFAGVLGAGGLGESVTPSYTDNTNVGTAHVTATYDGDANHDGSTDAETFEITKADSTVTVTCPANVTYTGSALTPCTANVTGVGGLNLTIPVDTYTANVDAGLAMASATWGGDANHTGNTGSANFTVDKASSTTTVTCPASVTYTGSAQTPCSANVAGAGGLSQALTVTHTDNVNAGTASASASYPGDANHLSSSDSETFTIAKASSTTSVSCPTSVTFTGAAQTPCTAAVTGTGGLDQSLTVGYANNVNAGTATASASYAGDTNHEPSSGSRTFTVDKAASTVTVTCPTSVVYTGTPRTPCSASLAGAGGLGGSPTVVYSDNTVVGTATAQAGFLGDANHYGDDDLATFQVTKATSAVTVTCPPSVTYTGAALTPCTAKASGDGMADVTLPVTYSGNTNAGPASASASWGGDANHTGSSGSGGFTVDKASSTTTVTCPPSVVYTGSAQTPCSANVAGAGGLSQALTVTHTDNVNAGTASASASYPGDANHLSSSDSKTFTIDKAPSTVTVTCPTSLYFTGSALTPCTAKASGVAMADVPVTPVTYTNNVAVGTATASATWAGDANHAAGTGRGTFAIASWRTNGFFQPVDMGGVYNTVKGGSTVPLKFELFSGTTELTDVAAVKSFTATQITCNSAAAIDDIELTTTGGTVLRYDSTGGQYIQNWQTPKVVGNCYRVTMTAQDASTIVAYFKTK